MSLAKLGGAGIFIKEIEHAIAEKEIDFAVHSLKDVPLDLTEGLTISSLPVREDPRDAYIAKDHIAFDDLPSGALIGTSSLRRSAQILAKRPDLKTKWIRGAVGARIDQLNTGDFDAIILAVAGLKRLGMENVITEYLDLESFVPAIGQGALAIECRQDDEELIQMLRKINDKETETSILTERIFSDLLDDNDRAPVGAYAEVKDGEITLYTSVASKDGTTVLFEQVHGDDPKEVAEEATDKLIKRGAKEIIAAFTEGSEL